MTTNEVKTERKIRANGAYAYRKVDGKHEFDWPGIGVILVDPARASMEARHFLLDYGFRQWLQDGAAKQAADGGKVDPLAKFAGMDARAQLLNSGATDLRQPRTGGGGGSISWCTRALVAIGTYQGNDVSTVDKANAFVKTLADNPKLGFGGQVGKVRTWLEQKSAIVKAKIEELKAAESLPDIDPDAEIASMMGA